MIGRIALLVGAMKAGTTALYHYLAQHPELAACPDKEPQFLCEPTRWKQGLGAYSALWPAFDSGRHRWALEASTEYTKLPMRANAVQASWSLPAEFRFLYMVRDPIARIRSHYLHSLARGWIERPINERLAPEAVLYSNYRFQIEPYVAAHGRRRIHVLSYEQFCAEPLEVVRGVCRFLEIDDTFAFKDPGPRNSSEGYRTVMMARLAGERGIRLTPSEPEQWEHRSQALEAALTSGRSPAQGLALLEDLDVELERCITPSAKQIEHLHELLDDDLARFEDDWGVDPWGRQRAPQRVRQPALPLGA